MNQRILSTVILWAVIFIAVWAFKATGGLWLLAIVSVLAHFELNQMLAIQGLKPLQWPSLAFGVLLIVSNYYAQGLGVQPGAVVLCIAAVTFMLLMLNGISLVKTIMPSLFGILLIPFMLQYYAMLMVLSGGTASDSFTPLLIPVWVIAVAKFSDVGGLLVGKQFGRHKMSPRISPNKTWEGAAGGVLFSILIGVLLNSVFQLGLSPWFCILAPIPIAITAIFSDLIESFLKRSSGIKDSGRVIPGIGGAFDLIDSLLLTGPVAYFLFAIFAF